VLLVLFDEFAQGELERLLYHALDSELPIWDFMVLDSRDVAVISHVEQFGACEETFIVEGR
jgi:hypothetical protein